MNQETNNPTKKSPVDLVPVPISLIRIYAILAVLLIVIPEWVAELIIALGNISKHNQLSPNSSEWETIPELKVSTMNLSELRLLAMRLNITGYSSDAKNHLTKRVLRQLNREISKKGRRGLFFE